MRCDRETNSAMETEVPPLLSQRESLNRDLSILLDGASVTDACR